MDFMPTFMQKGSAGRQIGMSRSGKGGRAPPPKKIIPTNFEAKVELKKSENAWVRSSGSGKGPSNEESEKEVCVVMMLYFGFACQLFLSDSRERRLALS